MCGCRQTTLDPSGEGLEFALHSACSLIYPGLGYLEGPRLSQNYLKLGGQGVIDVGG